MANITYLPVQGSIKLGREKVIALNQANIDAIKTSYSNDAKVLASQTTISNKDLLSQSFGTSPISSVSENQVSSATNFVEPVVDSPVQDKVITDLESSVVNMNVPNNNVGELNPGENLMVGVNNLSGVNVDSVPNVELVNNNLQLESTPEATTPINVSEPVIDTQLSNTGVAGNSTFNPINSEFNVSNGTNIFDLPPLSSGEEQNNIVMSDNLDVGTRQNISETKMDDSPIVSISSANDNNIDSQSNGQNLFTTPFVPSVDELKDTQITQEGSEISESNSTDSLNIDILEARIAIEKSNYNLYMNLAENSKKMAELLEKQLKKNEIDNTKDNLENTASYLFNANGVLDDTKVLGLNKVA